MTCFVNVYKPPGIVGVSKQYPALDAIWVDARRRTDNGLGLEKNNKNTNKENVLTRLGLSRTTPMLVSPCLALGSNRPVIKVIVRELFYAAIVIVNGLDRHEEVRVILLCPPHSIAAREGPFVISSGRQICEDALQLSRASFFLPGSLPHYHLKAELISQLGRGLLWSASLLWGDTMLATGMGTLKSSLGEICNSFGSER